MTEHRYFATCAKNLEALLATELTNLGLKQVKAGRGGASFRGSLEDGYRACLWSRIAGRVLLQLATFFAPKPEALYHGVRQIKWADHLSPDGTLVVDCNTGKSAIDHSHFGALKVKDAIVDQMRDEFGRRPSIDMVQPDLRVNLNLFGDQAVLSIDLSGGSLHRRGYRMQGGKAPLKETLAAAILAHARWPAIAAEGGSLVDPMCGAGTLLIEGALMAGDVAPGLGREGWGFSHWQHHDRELWQKLIDEAHDRREAGLDNMPPIYGFDRDERAITATRENLWQVGYDEIVHLAQRNISSCQPQPGPPGLVVVNPPYGERLSEETDLDQLYGELGRQLKSCFSGWRAAVFTGNPDLSHHLSLGADKKHSMFNGAIPCKLLHYVIR